MQPAWSLGTSNQHGLAGARPEIDQERPVADHLKHAIRVGLLVAAFTLAAAGATACRVGLAAAGNGSGQQVTVKALDTMRFDPATLTVSVGQPIQLALQNDGSLVHDLVLTDGVAQPVKLEANGRTTASATFTIARPGTYTYVCAQPGHEAAGMKGTIVAR